MYLFWLKSAVGLIAAVELGSTVGGNATGNYQSFSFYKYTCIVIFKEIGGNTKLMVNNDWQSYEGTGYLALQ